MFRTPLLVLAILAAAAATPAELRAQSIRLAFIGDSYTCGVGGGVDTSSVTEASCSARQPTTNPSWIEDTNLYLWGQQWSNYGYIPKLSWFLGNDQKSNQVVAVCCMNGATSEQALANDCGTKVNRAKPTHTFVLLGFNSDRPGVDTKGNIAKIMSQVTNGKKYCIAQGTCPDFGATQVNGWWGGLPAYPPGNVCSGHPNRMGYWTMAWNVWNDVKMKGQW